MDDHRRCDLFQKNETQKMNKSGIYLHIPFCKTKCIYCDFYSVTKRDDSIEKFVDCMVNEIKLNKTVKKHLV